MTAFTVDVLEAFRAGRKVHRAARRPHRARTHARDHRPTALGALSVPIHSDFSASNTLFNGSRLTAVLDWPEAAVPSGYRVPEYAPVRRYFEELIGGAAGTGIVVLVAEVDATVAGMTELVIRSEPPPDHQILVPRLLAECTPRYSRAFGAVA